MKERGTENEREKEREKDRYRNINTQYQTSHLTKFNNIGRTNLLHIVSRTTIFSDKLQMKCLGDR